MKEHGYTVVSPQFETHFFNGIDPPEYGADVVEIEGCRNATEAKALALKTREFSEWTSLARGDGVNPFSGLRVYPMRCHHGSCFCSQCRSQECFECEKETDEFLAATEGPRC